MKARTSVALARRPEVKPGEPGAASGNRALLADVRALILQARQSVAQAVNSGLTTLYWHIGRRIRQDILREKRAEYGERIVSALGTQLTAEFGRGFSGGTRVPSLRPAGADCADASAESRTASPSKILATLRENPAASTLAV